jgi:hypothetical protein
MAVRKLSIALDAEVAEAAARAAEREGLSLSAWINKAADEALAIERGLEGVRAYEAEFGPFTPEQDAWADRVWRRVIRGPRPLDDPEPDEEQEPFPGFDGDRVPGWQP